jgi:hypothetical protein
MRITGHERDKAVQVAVFAKGAFVKDSGYAFPLSNLFEGFPSLRRL